ncbi:MAG TPA: hypothetical protein DF613_15770 [Lachnospiraceae bacterium]|nr:hypothetical protein [Lachnospiraceae bacterium]
MELIMEILLEIFVGGASEAVSEKSLPLPVRILAAVLLLAFCAGVVGLLALLAVKSKNWVVTGIAVFMLVCLVVGAVKKYKELR